MKRIKKLYFQRLFSVLLISGMLITESGIKALAEDFANVKTQGSYYLDENSSKDFGTQAGDDESADVEIELKDENVVPIVHEPDGFVLADDDIAGGHYDNGTELGVTWVIDANGHLTISGTGEYELKTQTYIYDEENQWEMSLPVWYEYRESIKSATVSLTDIYNLHFMFCGCSNMVSVDITNLDTSKVVTMSFMFDRCKSLKSLDFSKLNTASVENMSFLFSKCIGLENWDLDKLNTENVWDMTGMFSGCSFESLDLSNFYTGNVTEIEDMFSECSNLKSIDISPLDLSRVEALHGLFDGCSSLENLTAGEFDFTRVKNADTPYGFSDLFRNCSSLKSLDLSGWKTENVSNMERMFYGCSSLEDLNLSGWDTSNVTSMHEMFYGCSSLEGLDLSNFNTANVWDMQHVFEECSSLKNINLSSFDTSNVKYINQMFYGCSSLKSLDLSNFNFQSLNQGKQSNVFRNCDALTEIKCPINVPVNTEIPLWGKGTWYRTDTNEEVTVVPAGLNASITLVFKGASASTNDKYTVTFEPLNGTDPIVKANIASGKTTALPKAPKRDGYIFSGWFTEKDGGGTQFTAKTKVYSNTTVYAKWVENTYNITFNKNGGKIVDTMTLSRKKGILYTAEFNLPGIPNETRWENVGINKALIYRDGYILTGWNTKAKGNKTNGIGTHYDLGQTVSMLSGKNKGNVTLYAEWTPIIYTITYVLNDAEPAGTPAKNAVTNPDTHSVLKAVSLKAPMRTGYTFGGWYADEKLTVKLKSIKKTLTEDVTAYAKWTENTYSISFNKNGGVIADKDAVAKKTGILYTESVTLPAASTMTRNGYVFAGWNTKKNGTGDTYEAGAVVSKLSLKKKGSVTLYAQWVKIE